MLNPPVPLKLRTAVFCFLMGAVCSPVITAVAPPKWVHLLPARYDHIPVNVLLISYLLLPLWSAFAVREYKPLPQIGMALFLVLFLYGLLFPSLG